MKTSLLTHAHRVLSVLPFAQAFTKQPQSPQLIAAAALANAPFVRRVAPGLSTTVTIGLAAIAALSFIRGLKRRQNPTARDKILVRSSAK